MISIIVPIYKVELYIRQCVDSILAQTYRDIEIILIDDGSPDSCGDICDEYAVKDSRIRVFHTENKGLSAARNLGISKAEGDYIAFVDSDDWIEPDMYEVLKREMDKADADMGVCGTYKEYVGSTESAILDYSVLASDEAERAVITGKLSTSAMDKLFRKQLFSCVRFPDGRYFEDVTTINRLIRQSSVVCTIPTALYHYRQRAGSIMYNYKMAILKDDWLAHKEMFLYYSGLREYHNDKEIIDKLLYYCAESITKTWKNAFGTGDWRNHPELFEEMSKFSRKYIPLFGEKSWPRFVRLCTFMSKNTGGLSLLIAYCAAQFIRLFRKKARLYP